MTTGRITEAQLAQLWRISPSTLAKWRCSNLVVPDSSTVSTDGPHWYLLSTVAAIHRSGNMSTRHNHSLPDPEGLLKYQKETGEPALLLAREVTNRRHISRDRLYRETRAGKIVAIRTPSGTLLYPATLIAQPAKAEPNLPLAEVEHILGLGATAITALCETSPPELVRVNREDAPEQVFISEASLHTYLKRYLEKDSAGRPFCSSAGWRKLREEHGYDPLLTTQVIKRNYHVHGRAVRAAIASGALPCLRTAGGHARVPMHAVITWARKRS